MIPTKRLENERSLGLLWRRFQQSQRAVDFGDNSSHQAVEITGREKGWNMGFASIYLHSLIL
jgi:hypothetical protein